jgi:hypothetical protein
VPDAVAKEGVLEAIDRMGDASIQACSGRLSRPANLSACRHSVIRLNMPRVEVRSGPLKVPKVLPNFRSLTIGRMIETIGGDC